MVAHEKKVQSSSKSVRFSLPKSGEISHHPALEIFQWCGISDSLKGSSGATIPNNTKTMYNVCVGAAKMGKLNVLLQPDLKLECELPGR